MRAAEQSPAFIRENEGGAKRRALEDSTRQRRAKGGVGQRVTREPLKVSFSCSTLHKLTKDLQNGFPCGIIKIRVSPQTEQHTNNYTKWKLLYDEAREVPKGAKRNHSPYKIYVL
jgi:hypothetical protein